MKKSIIVCTILFTLSTVVVKAQEAGKHEINVSYGDGAPTTLVDGFSNAFTNALVSGISGLKTNNTTESFGSIGLGYRNQITERIRVGGDIAFQQVQSKITDEKNKLLSKRTDRYLMVLPTISFSYIKTDWLDFYGSAAAGVLLNNSEQQSEDGKAPHKSNNVDFAFQVNPAGIRVGKKIGVFAEVGFGHRGIVVAGINYKF